MFSSYTPQVVPPQINTPIETATLDARHLVPATPTPDFDRDVLIPLRKAQAEKAEADRKAAEEAARVEAERVAEAARQVELARQQEAARVQTVQAQAVYGNNYAWGQCTWYVASRRSVPLSMGNANMWATGLVAAGWHEVGPTPGAVATTQAGPFGHVAFVESVGTGVGISEMNFNGGVGQVNYRTVEASAFRYFLP